jgi:short-subunit dehydrogenase
MITGASSGIGRELAKLFARDGARLVLVARSREPLDTLARTLETEHGVAPHIIVADLARIDELRRIDTELSERAMAVDVLVNNAAFGMRGAVAELSADEQLDMIHVNVVALTFLTRLLLPAMLERRRGGILNVASTAAFQPGPNMSVYYATKAYVLSFTEALAEELRSTGVRVCCLAPGPTATAFQSRAGMENSRLFRLGAADARSVAEAGHRGYRRGKVLVIPGWRNRAGVLAARLAPRAFVRKTTAFLHTPVGGR